MLKLITNSLTTYYNLTACGFSLLRRYLGTVRGCIHKFPVESITKYMLTTINTR